MFLARIVIPFSRSRSIESMTRSATSWFSRNEPDCQSIASTSVVLPWSTWATIATLRRSSRRAVRFAGTGRQGSQSGRECAGTRDRGSEPRSPDTLSRMPSKRQSANRSAQRLGERERAVGLEPDDDAARWLSERRRRRRRSCRSRRRSRRCCISGGSGSCASRSGAARERAAADRRLPLRRRPLRDLGTAAVRRLLPLHAAASAAPAQAPRRRRASRRARSGSSRARSSSANGIRARAAS